MCNKVRVYLSAVVGFYSGLTFKAYNHVFSKDNKTNRKGH